MRAIASLYTRGIKPSETLRTIFGDDVVFDPAPCFRERGWLPRDRATLDALTGNQIAIAGDTPYVCHAAAATPRALRLLADAGHARPGRLLRYGSEKDYGALLAGLKGRVVLNHAHAVPIEDLWIDEALLRNLNDKGRLEEIAPPESTARRRVVPAGAFAAMPPAELPVVAKAASGRSSGAGFGVRVCRTGADFRRAQADLARAPAIVLEEWLDIEASWCLQFAVRPDGSTRYLGAAEQVTGPGGAWFGNWIDGAAPERAVAMGAATARAAAARGYRGVAGFDVARTADGRLVLLDANFRFNGSTVALLLAESLGAPVVRSAGWSFDGPFESLERLLRGERGHFVATGFWDPPRGAPSLTGLVHGASREEVAARLRELERGGFRSRWREAA